MPESVMAQLWDSPHVSGLRRPRYRARHGQRETGCGSRSLQVLELGAATGGTAAAAGALAAEGSPGPAVDYLCTDPSELLLGAAPARLARHARVRLACFDMHAEPGPHPLRARSFDIVVSTGVLAGARYPGATARRLAALAAPGGWPLLTEPTREPYEDLISRAFLPSATEAAGLLADRPPVPGPPARRPGRCGSRRAAGVVGEAGVGLPEPDGRVCLVDLVRQSSVLRSGAPLGPQNWPLKPVAISSPSSQAWPICARVALT
ncbi:hypothetical protein GCM10010441_06410 [Kitasatospora paracochleata]|uniref:SAM-dependent methyltransferase n=1 Tax=Kitasatospora paracochleata TaxID=58354 RepID=A0ABT1IX93_9ACTN|nr:class I SAM-dependent methyltransferase [Kitasatospora paracochleata]MCP2309569.1 SAM-dependent methyltransferase [Kitasatospora paracochleata]